MEQYNENFKKNHDTLNDLVSWLMTWNRYTTATKRSSDSSNTRSSKRRINRDDDDTNETS